MINPEAEAILGSVGIPTLGLVSLVAGYFSYVHPKAIWVYPISLCFSIICAAIFSFISMALVLIIGGFLPDLDYVGIMELVLLSMFVLSMIWIPAAVFGWIVAFVINKTRENKVTPE